MRGLFGTAFLLISTACFAADYIPPGDTGETPPGGENAGGAVVSGGKQRGENHHAGSLGRQGKTAS